MTDPRAMDCDTVRDLAPLFVLGALEPAEEAAVREHLATCPDAHAEVLDLAEPAASLLLLPEAVEPPPALKARLLAAAEADLREGRHPSTSVATAATVAEAPTAHAAPAPEGAAAPAPAPEPAAPQAPAGPISLELARQRRRFRLASLAAAAAVLVAVALGGYALTLRGELADQEAYRQAVEQTLALAAEPGSATAVIAGGEGATSGLGAIGADGTVELAVRGLAPTPGREVYTAWAIGADGAPVSLGDFEVGGAGTGVASGTSPVTGAGTVLALTLEPQPGATAPAGPIVASGTATAPGA